MNKTNGIIHISKMKLVVYKPFMVLEWIKAMKAIIEKEWVILANEINVGKRIIIIWIFLNMKMN